MNDDDKFIALAKLAQQGILTFDPCFGNIGTAQFYFSTKPQGKTKTTSLSSINFGELLQNTNLYLGNVVLKMWLSTKNQQLCPPLEGLEYETKVYQFITNRILLYDIAPNFIPFIAYGVCDRNTVTENLPKLKKPLRNLAIATSKSCPGRQIKSKNYSRLHILITQSACTVPPCFTLHDLISQRPEPTNQWSPIFCAAILFVLTYSLHVLWNNTHIQHNDLHSKNILLRDVDPDRPLHVYVFGRNLDTDVYIISTYVLPRQPVIFDWDRSYVDVKEANIIPEEPQFTGPSKNMNLEAGNCSKYGQCNIPNEYFDFYTLLCNIQQGDLGQKTLQLLVPELCNYIQSLEKERKCGHTCLPFQEQVIGLQTYFLTPEQFLSLNQFNAFLASNIANQGGLHAECVRNQLRNHNNQPTIFQSYFRNNFLESPLEFEEVDNYLMNLFLK